MFQKKSYIFRCVLTGKSTKWEGRTVEKWYNLTVLDLLNQNGEVFLNKLAIIDEKTESPERSCGKESRVNRLAIHLKRLGVEYGDFFVSNRSSECFQTGCPLSKESDLFEQSLAK